MLGKKLPKPGDRSSKPTGKRLRNDPRRLDPRLELLLGEAFERLKEGRRSADDRDEFVFHMTDWVDDLKDLARLYRYPEKFTAPEAEQTVSGFFIHAIAHLKAGRRLVMPDITDAFDDSPTK